MNRLLKSFPFRLFFWMNIQFLVLTFIAFYAIKAYDISFLYLFLAEILIFMYVAAWSLTPLIKAKKYLSQLLKQPRTENLKVEGGERYQQVFKKGEWIELGELFWQLERKLRRRTKAYLREATELSALMNSLTSPIIAITENLDVSFLNSSFAVLFNVDFNFNDYDRTNLSKFDDLIKNKELVQVLKEAIELQSFEQRHIVLDVAGRKRTFVITMSPLRRQIDNSLYGVVASLSDETQKIELDRKRMDFVSNASHELRTPIAAISSSVSLLQRIEDSEDQKEVIRSLDSNAKRLFQLTQDLLDLSKLEREQEELEVTHCDLSKLTKDSLESLSHRDTHLVQTEFQIDKFPLDESKVKQVVVNLVKNALIHTPDETLVFLRWYTDDRGLVLEVEDQGPGISQDMKERIFERFYRIDKSRSRKAGGSGIGLSIVKHVVTLHGGETRLLAPKNGQGALFQCYFPVPDSHS